MDPTRRTFLRSLSGGATALSAQSKSPQREARPMPGRPAGGSSSVPAGSTVMSIAAHPGDVFFAMGAPIAQHIHNGGRGVFVSLTLGEKGSPTIPAPRYGAMQRGASERAARALGAHNTLLTYPDGFVPFNDAVCMAVSDLIRKYKPAVVITHWKGSWHKDHRNCYRVVRDALFYAALPAIVRKLPAHSVDKIYFAENWEDAKGFQADTYLDITDSCERWLKACGLFPMWRGETGFLYDKYYGSMAVANGCLSGFQRAVALMSNSEELTRRVSQL